MGGLDDMDPDETSYGLKKWSIYATISIQFGKTSLGSIGHSAQIGFHIQTTRDLIKHIFI